MISRGEVLGLMILGDRVGGVSFSWQDFDLLKCVGDQVAAGLLNAQLSQKLLQAKELEAFQTMSAFFVHDLKNTASTLNLMLQNLPVHFDDPEFRADALRGMSKTVAHINHLIGRLSQLRHELQIKPVESDLNEVVARALAGWEEAAGVSLVKDLQSSAENTARPGANVQSGDQSGSQCTGSRVASREKSASKPPKQRLGGSHGCPTTAAA